MIAFRLLAVLALATLAVPAYSQTAGRDYLALSPPQQTGSPGKVEVLEFFSYGCPHCYELHPLISQWSAQLPDNAVLVRVPISLGRREWGQLVRAYYALEATGDLTRLDTALFEAIHKERQPLFNEERITAWAAAHGVDPEKFRAQFNSFDVSRKASRAEQMSRDYRISGVPQLAVAGRYTVLGKTHEDTLRIARQLIDKAASENSP